MWSVSWTKTMASVFAKPKRRKQCALHKTTLLCTKPHFVDVLQTKGSDFYSMAAGFTRREAVPALFMTHAIPGTRPTRLCHLPCPNLRLMLSTRCPWPHWFCLLQIKSKPPARNSAWNAQTSSVEQCHAEVCDSAWSNTAPRYVGPNAFVATATGVRADVAKVRHCLTQRRASYLGVVS